MPINLSKVRNIRDELKVVLESEHFRIHYGRREPGPERANQGCGVADDSMIRYYASGLERLYRIATSSVFEFPAPTVDGKGKTNVYIFDIALVDLFGDPASFTTFEGFVPIIGLPCRLPEPFGEIVLRRAATEASHEAAHVFTWSIRDPQKRTELKWRWFNEATAVYLEGEAFPGSSECIRPYGYWSDHPEVPLDKRGPDPEYASGMFARFVSRKYGPQYVRRAWTDSYPDESPTEAIDRLLGKSIAGECAIFSEYCLDSAFLLDPMGTLFAPAVHGRFRGRYLTESYPLSSAPVIIKGTLDHLSSRYYRLDKPGAAANLNFKLESPSPAIRAEAAEVTRLQQRGDQWRLPAQIGIQTSAGVDHLVLVVSNSSLTEDGVEFEIHIG